jgi:superfamily II DNA/RNA helicase
MAEHVKIKEIRDVIKNPAHLDNTFQILKIVASMVNNPSYDEKEVQELVLRLLDRKEEFSGFDSLLNALAREIGLFPYLNVEELGLSDLIAYEYHRPLGLENIVFHRIQAEIYRDLLEGKNVILSAPTSFGKSIIIDAVIATKKFNNIVIVVPTIALIDETRRRFSRFKDHYKIITHNGQVPSNKNLFVLTQERVMEFLNQDQIDFFVIDEFYKISPREDNDERSIVLNQAFYKLYKTRAQFYLLGPNIEHISGISKGKIDFIFKKTDYKTVVTEFHYVTTGDSPYRKLIELVKSLKDPTLIYCRSPNSVNKVAVKLIESGYFSNDRLELQEAAEWIKNNYHPDWLLVKALEKGIGIHHGKIPRSLSQFFIRSFNSGIINYLLCTSTIIEGVNTSAKNVIIFDNKIAKKKIDYFTFNNISGRSGRMFKHFIGNVYLFHEPPQSQLPTVDFPLFSQNDETPDRLLMQMDDDDLDIKLKDKIYKYKEQNILDFDTLKANSISNPNDQLDLAKEILSNIDYYYINLNWNGIPKYEQLKVACELIWIYLIKSKGLQSGVASGSQLTYRIWRILSNNDIKSMIAEETENIDDVNTINSKIDELLDFMRIWAMYKFPKLLLVLNSIQSEIFKKKNLTPGDYTYFAYCIENLFLDPSLIALDEFGIPIQVSKKMYPWIKPDKNLDTVLLNLKKIDIDELPLDEFEKELVKDALRHL